MWVETSGRVVDVAEGPGYRLLKLIFIGELSMNEQKLHCWTDHRLPFAGAGSYGAISKALIFAQLGMEFGIKDIDGKQPRLYPEPASPLGRFIQRSDNHVSNPRRWLSRIRDFQPQLQRARLLLNCTPFRPDSWHKQKGS